jgi:sulfhydrogenase subunit gamma (sulfur reductase)
MENPYLPMPMRIEHVVVETEDKNIRTFSLSFLNAGDKTDFQYTPGQFAERSVLGKGEAPFGMASSPMNDKCLEFTVSKAGVVTTALHNMEPGEFIGIRGPLGNGFPIRALKGKDIVIIGGGFGFSTLRALTNFMLDPHHRNSFGDITVIYGARSPGMLLYRNELQEWEERDDLRLYLTVDRGDNGWKGKVGVVPEITKEVAPSSENAYALVCGPPIMIKYTLPVVQELGFPPGRVIVSLEMKMKCGIGMCGRCNIGNKYVCHDGPVFTLEQLNQLPQEY